MEIISSIIILLLLLNNYREYKLKQKYQILAEENRMMFNRVLADQNDVLRSVEKRHKKIAEEVNRQWNDQVNREVIRRLKQITWSKN